MRIGIIGNDHIGATLARQLIASGNEVAVANPYDPQKPRDLAAELGDWGRASTPEEAAEFGDVVVIAVPFREYDQVPVRALEGKTVIDVGNYDPARDGPYARLESDETTSSEVLAEHLQGARVVKAFNAIVWQQLRDRGHTAGMVNRIGIPVASDDEAAKQVAFDLIEQIGFHPVDAGGLSAGGRKFQPDTPLYTADLSGENLRARLAL
jgi:predicted dinucleotide-binding enzyme